MGVYETIISFYGSQDEHEQRASDGRKLNDETLLEMVDPAIDEDR
jgi:hypothetical protein